ncbi:hypothetical protein BH11ARM2_BH11ARM2_38920 [soil metagenome]
MEVTLRYGNGVFVPENPIDVPEGIQIWVNVRTKEEIEDDARKFDAMVANFPDVKIPDGWEFNRGDIYD